jgi:ABC-type glycerol-3-phosphate transport system substrate-binding protein
LKRYLDIIKGLALIALLFVSVGVVVASDDSDDIHTVSVTITQTSASENGADAVTNNYEKEITTTESTDVQITGVVSENEASLTTNLGDMATDNDDVTTTESDDTLAAPEFKIGESPEEFTAKLNKWISFMVDSEDMLININDFRM